METMTNYQASADITLPGKISNHKLIELLTTKTLTKSQIEELLIQWWFPLKTFPSLLSQAISGAPTIKVQTALSKVLYQELGEGDIQRSHAGIFLMTCEKIGIDCETVLSGIALPTTDNLTEEFQNPRSIAASIASVIATEALDLVTVSAIGSAMTKFSGIKNLPWVNIHIVQEPDHTCSTQIIMDEYIEQGFDVDEIVGEIESHWNTWDGYFTGVYNRIVGTP